MDSRLGRRTFLAGSAAAAVVAFDPAGLGWVTEADASATQPGAVGVPHLDGELVVDEESLAEAADDYGHLVHRRPVAVLRPGSVRDVVRMVQYAGEHGLKVAMRGQGHSTFGQAQAGGGVVIDSRTLATIHRIDQDRAVVDAGVQWLDLVRATVAEGLTPPVNTDYLGLSVGGTLSVGGIGGASSHHGMQVDNVLELEVVTGSGRHLRCSPTVRPALFRSVLGGLGQFAIIVRAAVRLVPAESTARVYNLYYPDLASMTAAQRTALADRRFSYLEGQLIPAEGGWRYMLEGVEYHTPPEVPDDAALLAGLDPASTEIVDMPYFDWLNRIYALVEDLKPLRLPGPWINVFVPDAATDAYVADVLADLTPADAGGVVLLYPVPRELLTLPFVTVPDSEVIFLLAILRAVDPPNEADVQRLLGVNRDLYDQVRAVGGTHYPVGAIPLTPADWRAHYGDRYPRFALAKATYDPRHVLAPGQGIFE
ncbi:FAD-binding protein [Actinophytocola gossypii]|uniref:FAD-binding protein n=1 Tax=Actinophytocola gossypii TaxID=2812003 RepID=A0ABT2JDB0_9PSEU|nr:FAD-binding protein [Actinophytocola gossypii]MCT2585861.1 FAD-binding protein [Actinophytocola gossypii]